MTGEVKIRFVSCICPNHVSYSKHICPCNANVEALTEKLDKLQAENAALKAENEEQARLLGMGGSREAKLLAQVTALREALEKIAKDWLDPNERTTGWCKQPDCDLGPSPAGHENHRPYCAFQIAHDALKGAGDTRTADTGKTIIVNQQDCPEKYMKILDEKQKDLLAGEER